MGRVPARAPEYYTVVRAGPATPAANPVEIEQANRGGPAGSDAG